MHNNLPLISLASDLHLEFEPITLHNDSQSSVLILSGDIMTAAPLYYEPNPKGPSDPNVIWKPSKNQTLSMRYQAFLEDISGKYDNIIMVAGNHEYYGGRFPDAIDWMKHATSRFPNIHYLEKDHIEIEGVTYVGGTLWTNMHKRNPITMSYLIQEMNDSKKIKASQHNFRRLLPIDTCTRHDETLEYIREIVDSDPNKTYVVVSHHTPSSLSIHPTYKYDHDYNGAYYSDLSEFILDRPQIKLWTCGHVHTAHSYYMGETLIASNPRGYAGYQKQAETFQLFDIDLGNMPEKFDGVEWRNVV